MTSGPYEMLGTKCPSITSRWIQSAPAASTARTSSPSFEKSEARIDGALTSGRGEKEADIGAVFRMFEAVFRLTRANTPGNARQKQVEKFASGGTNCRPTRLLQTCERHEIIHLFPWHGAC